MASKDTSEPHVLRSEKLESTVTKLTHLWLSIKHSVPQKAVSDLSNEKDSLQTQVSKLSKQIKSISDTLGNILATSSTQLVSNHKSNVLVYGVDENPPKTARNVQLQKDMETTLQIFNIINVHIDPTHNLDCFWFGKFKSQ